MVRSHACERLQVKVNKNVRMRRQWIKFGDCDGQDLGLKETGVVMIAEPVTFDLFGQEEVNNPRVNVTMMVYLNALVFIGRKFAFQVCGTDTCGLSMQMEVSSSQIESEDDGLVKRE